MGIYKSNLEVPMSEAQDINTLKQLHPLCTFKLFLYLHEDGNFYLFESDSPEDVYFSSSSNGDYTLKSRNLFSDIRSRKPLIIPSPIWSTNIDVEHDKADNISISAYFDVARRHVRIQHQEKNYNNYHFLGDSSS